MQTMRPFGSGVVFVGDRANDRVLMYDATTLDVITTLAASEGIFHQWISGATLAVNSDVSRQTHVYTVSATKGEDAGTIAMPADLAATAEAKPHDVFVSPDETSIYVTYIGFTDKSYVVRFTKNGANWTEANRAEVGGDSHLYLLNDQLFVPCQDSGEVVILNPSTLAVEETLSLAGAHGITATSNHIFVGNISVDENAVVAAISTGANPAIIPPASAIRPPATTEGKPHNLWFNSAGSRLYITHSGPTSHWVSTYKVSGSTVTPDSTAIDVGGMNPFGLTFVPSR